MCAMCRLPSPAPLPPTPYLPTGPIWRPPAPNQVVRSLDVFSAAPAELTDMLLAHARLTGGGWQSVVVYAKVEASLQVVGHRAGRRLGGVQRRCWLL